jgi:hypothetical protein
VWTFVLFFDIISLFIKNLHFLLIPTSEKEFTMLKKYSKVFIVLYVSSIFVALGTSLFVGEAQQSFVHSYQNLDFTSSMIGVNYEVTLTNKGDPAQFCLIEGRNDDIQIIALDYFYITQGDQLIHGVAIDNSRFEIRQELSGCWKVMREKDGLRMRLINLSNSDIFFETKDSNLENMYAEKYEEITRLLAISGVTLISLFAVLAFVLMFLSSK